METPYSNLPSKAFWRTAIAAKNALQIDELWDPKGSISRDARIVTFGSCFAQHIGQAFKARGYNWYDAEPGPKMVSTRLLRECNYGIFSARTANVYTARALLQWMRYALGHEAAPTEVWERKGSYYDPLRPSIEPEGFASPEELFESRDVTLASVRHICETCDVFVFTLGLTEAWVNRKNGLVYAACPGTIAGTFDPELHAFHNCTVEEIIKDMREVIGLVAAVNSNVRFLLTVSPVPLTATAAGQHVLVSTTYSKSVLRAVAGQLAEEFDRVDYFPSYEIITAPPFRGMFYEPNARSVAPEGVSFVMTSFFDCLSRKFPAEAEITTPRARRKREETLDVAEAEDEHDQAVCEEQMLVKYAPVAG